MVQRKGPNMLGIQADHVTTEKLLGNLKPASFCQHQDDKNRSSDIKKKMKRSRSITLSDIGGLKSSPLRKTISQPGKPPLLTNAASPQKQPTCKEESGSPNYMTSTSCSKARNEQSLASSLNFPTGSGVNNLRQRNSSILKDTSASSHKPTKTLKKPSSLEPVRTLQGAPSFKPVEGTTKKGTRLYLCADVNVQRATCSSMLKDSKHPEYLMLNPGGTEAEGTSIVKVCPYTYCSLQRWRHSSKTQKSTNQPFLYSIDQRRNPLTREPAAMNKGSWFCGALENLSTKSTPAVIDFAGSFQGCSDTSSMDIDFTEDIPIQSQEFAASLYQDEDFLKGSDFEEDESTSESADAGWVEEQFSDSGIDAKDDNLNISEHKIEQLFETMKFDFHGMAELRRSDEIVNNFAEEIVADQVLTDPFQEEANSFDVQSVDNIRRWAISWKNPAMKTDIEKKFNPRKPNFLQVVPDSEAEKVILKHQWIEDRKNADEWMLDFALQQVITKLAPDKKRKVALLAEAFEAVLPMPKYDTHISHASTGFPSRSIQACGRSQRCMMISIHTKI